MYTLCALLPLVLALVLMIRFRVSPGKALPVSLLLTAFSGFFLWKMSVSCIAAVTILGVLKSLDIILILFGAIFLLNILRAGGALDTVNRTLSTVSSDRRIQVIIIAWLFSNFIEGSAGFGAAPALVAPLLAGLGFPLIPALMTSLVLNSLAVPFGAVGTPVLAAEATLKPSLVSLGMNEAAFNAEMISDLTTISALSGMFLPFVAVSFMILLSGDRNKWRSMAEIFPFALFAGIAYVVPWKLTAVRLGPELPSIIGSLAALPLVLLVLKTGLLTPRRVWDFPERQDGKGNSGVRPDSSGEKPDGKPSVSPAKAWLPYIAIAVLLMVTRLPLLPLKSLMAGACTISLPEIFHVSGTNFRWAVLINPGVFPFLAVAAGAAWLYGIGPRPLADVLRRTEKQLRMPALAIAASFALVQIMIFSGGEDAPVPGMLTLIAQGAAELMGRAFVAVSPVIGVFGTFFSGSCTVSNILFCSIQFNTAHLLNLPEPLIAALQNVGGGLGSMLRISGIVAACATVNARGLEGKLILLNTIPAAVMVILSLAAALIFL